MLKTLVLLAFAVFAISSLMDRWETSAFAAAEGLEDRSQIIRLGERLFRDDRFSTRKGDLPASCSDCHFLDENAQGLRAYADFFNRSWVSSRPQDPRRLGLRNAPTILDVADIPRLHYDGEFSSLEGLVKGTMSGRPMGWLPGEESEAFEHSQAVLLTDVGEGNGAETYKIQFRRAFGVEIERLSRDDVVNLLARSVAEYCRTLKTVKDSPYDRFIQTNGLESRPAAAENGLAFANRLLRKIEGLEATGSLRLASGFDRNALQGMIVFFNAERGNCVSCHTPPQFTDNSFHNLGISQREYERFHGEGSFTSLQIPTLERSRRPSAQFREIPSREKPGMVDLGFWNFVDPKSSSLRRPGESDERFLQRMIGTFKTPTLRNLIYSEPYFHNGSLTTLEDALKELVVLSEMARAGQVREADDELAKIRIRESDTPALVSFLKSLSEDLRRR